MVHDPDRNHPIDPNEEDPPEDSLVIESLRNLARIQVPATFLPNVMLQVYERHHRGKISLRLVLMVSLLMLVASVGFFIWDVVDYMREQSLNFEEACETRADQALAYMERLLASITAFLAATWDILVSLMNTAFTSAPFISTVVLLTLTAALVYMIRRRF